ncbi:MAG: ABC transporter ATP-binding protein [Candidatus Helarchaeota archaeon]|nr:ABC transporter ATP-binding protein [Candidatus Helarchaeota archaeon]
MPRFAVKAENVWKQYRIRHHFEGSTSSLKEILNSPINRIIHKVNGTGSHDESETFWALKDVSFEISHGESVGLIGRNGAGKTTLLKILSRITRPSRGKLVIFERVNSLLEIGTGFNTELSGRDNVYLNGSFLGMKHQEIQNRFDEIVAFSEIEQFIDTPVKYYSSGMYVRLAFSVAVHLTPELLLLDEVLAVGDAGFQQKSLEKMKELLSSGATIIFVSHNQDAVKKICKRAIWLQNGEMKMDGESILVVDHYMQSIV